MSAKKMWSCFILNKSSFEGGKFELSANTLMNPDFRVHSETIVAEIFPCIFMGVVGFEIQLYVGFCFFFLISNAKIGGSWTETPGFLLVSKFMVYKNIYKKGDFLVFSYPQTKPWASSMPYREQNKKQKLFWNYLFQKINLLFSLAQK